MSHHLAPQGSNVSKRDGDVLVVLTLITMLSVGNGGTALDLGEQGGPDAEAAGEAHRRPAVEGARFRSAPGHRGGGGRSRRDEERLYWIEPKGSTARNELLEALVFFHYRRVTNKAAGSRGA